MGMKTVRLLRFVVPAEAEGRIETCFCPGMDLRVVPQDAGR